MPPLASLSAPPKLSEANRRGWRQWLTLNTLYPKLAMVALVCLVSLSARAAESLPAAPTPQPHPVFSKTDWALSAGVFATHLGDLLSTEQCIHGTRCKEVVLPQALVHRDGLFAAYEFATAAAEIYGAHELTRMGHPRMARVVQLVNVGMTARTVALNYERSWKTPRPRN